jgi:hypothetical protein
MYRSGYLSTRMVKTTRPLNSVSMKTARNKLFKTGENEGTERTTGRVGTE